MNIVVQCCGLVLLMVIICFYISQKHLQLKTSKAFIGILVVTTVSLALDICSMVLLYYRDRLPLSFVRFGCKAYISSLIWIGIFCVIYLCADIYENGRQFVRYRKWLCAIGFCATAVLFMLPIYLHTKDPYDTYTYGPATTLTYGFALLSVIVLTYLNITHGAAINPSRRRAIWLWLTVWVLAAMIQFLNSSLLLVGYASAVGIVIIYLKLENPESYIDRDMGLFNESAFLLYVKELMNQGQDYYMISFAYEIRASENLLTGEADSIHMEIGWFVQHISGASAFRLSDGKLVLIFLTKDALDDAYHLLRVRFAHRWGMNQMRLISPKWYYMGEPRLLEQAEDYLALLRYAAHVDKECVELDREMASELYGEQQAEKMIIDAMNEDRIEVFYQPIFSTKKQKFVSAEALVRIRDKEGGIVPPSAFIAVAERTGLIIRLGEIVFKQVCCFIQQNDMERYDLEFIDVNLSIVQCSSEHLAASFKKIMEETGVAPSYINLEITETASLKERRILLQNMQELREYGVTFSLDDFGTGQSNLNYIVDMPVDIVKFDRDMTQAYFDNRKAKYVMDATMHMIHGLQLNIVAEGVETEKQFITLAGMGIGFIQGYYFSKPLPAKAFLEFLED